MSVCHFQCFVGPRYKLWGDSTMVWLLGLVIICWLLIWESNNCDLWSTVGFWGKTNFRELRMFINIQEVSHWYVLCWSVSRGSHLYVACWAFDFWLARNVLVCPFDRLIFMGQRSNWSHAIWSFDFHSLEVTLIPWSALKKGFDHMIQFWSQSQMLLHGTYKWLPLVFCYQNQNGINVHFIKGSK